MEKNTAETKRTTIDTKYENLENKINELLSIINSRPIKDVSNVFYQELVDFINANNLVLFKDKNGNYNMKNGERGKKFKPLSKEMIYRLKLLGYYIEQDSAEESIIKALVNSMQELLNGENDKGIITGEYEIIEIKSLNDNPNELSVTIIDNTGRKVEGIIIPMVFTRFVRQSIESIAKIEMPILFSLQKRLDGLLNKLLNDIENEYLESINTESFREKFINGDDSLEDIINGVFEQLHRDSIQLTAFLREFKLLRYKEDIYLQCYNNSLKLPESIVKKLLLLGYYDEKQNALIESVERKILNSLITSAFYHDVEYLTPEDCYFSEISTIGDLVPDNEKGKPLTNLNGLAICVNQTGKEEMFRDKAVEHNSKETKALLPYRFMKIATQSDRDAFGTEMEILSTINDLFLQNTQVSEVNSGAINRVLRQRGITLKMTPIEGEIQFIAKKGKHEILIDKKISQNILAYMKYEIQSVAINEYGNNQDNYEKEQLSAEDMEARRHEIHLIKTFKVLAQLQKRGYTAKAISTGIIEQNTFFARNPMPNKLILSLPYGIEEDFSELNDILNRVINNKQSVDLSEILIMLAVIQSNEEANSNLEEYKQILKDTKNVSSRMPKLLEKWRALLDKMMSGGTTQTQRFTRSKSQAEPPTVFFRNLIPELRTRKQEHIKIPDGAVSAEIVDNSGNPLIDTYAKF